MLNLLNSDEKRGIVILSSKDFRTLDRALKNWKLNSDCIMSYLEDLESGRFSFDSEYEKHAISAIREWIKDSRESIKEARKVIS